MSGLKEGGEIVQRVKTVKSLKVNVCKGLFACLGWKRGEEQKVKQSESMVWEEKKMQMIISTGNISVCMQTDEKLGFDCLKVNMS